MRALVLPILIVLWIAECATGLPSLASDLDERIMASARESYVFETYLKNDDIEIVSRDGLVSLTGTVTEEFHRDLAQETVASLPNVKGVDNRLELRGGPLAENLDAKIAAKVKTALMFRRNVDSSQIQVSVRDGIVTLQGSATSQVEKELTTQYAANVDGVKVVRNQMAISTTAKDTYEATMRGRIDDASITAQVKMALLFDRATSVLNTQVSTTDGVVILRGVARNDAERALVDALVGDVRGVKGVENKMTIEAPK